MFRASFYCVRGTLVYVVVLPLSRFCPRCHQRRPHATSMPSIDAIRECKVAVSSKCKMCPGRFEWIEGEYRCRLQEPLPLPRQVVMREDPQTGRVIVSRRVDDSTPSHIDTSCAYIVPNWRDWPVWDVSSEAFVDTITFVLPPPIRSLF